MNNKEFISALADKVGRTQDETQKLVKTALQAMGDNFESGEPYWFQGSVHSKLKSDLNELWLILPLDYECLYPLN